MNKYKLFCFSVIKYVIFVHPEMQQINALALSFGACLMNLVLLASSNSCKNLRA